MILAFDEIFENDLRSFMRKADDDEKEESNISTLKSGVQLKTFCYQKLLIYNMLRVNFVYKK